MLRSLPLMWNRTLLSMVSEMSIFQLDRIGNLPATKSNMDSVHSSFVLNFLPDFESSVSIIAWKRSGFSGSWPLWILALARSIAQVPTLVMSR